MTLHNAQNLFCSAPAHCQGDPERLRLLLTRLGNPERKLSILPVTGHKGKSSVIRMLGAVMAHSGISTVSAILPCLPSPKENIFIGEKSLSGNDFIAYTDALYAAVRALRREEAELLLGDPFTRTELLLALALVVASKVGAKRLLLEIPPRFQIPSFLLPSLSPVTVVTSCTDALPSETLPFIRSGLNEIVSARITDPSVYAQISAASAKAGCRLTFPAFSSLVPMECSLCRTTFSYREEEYAIPYYGDHAVTNALCAIEAATALARHGCSITNEAIQKGLAEATLPAHGEVLSIRPTVLIDTADDSISVSALLEMIARRGDSLGTSVTVCAKENDPHLAAVTAQLQSLGIRISDTVPFCEQSFYRTASALLKAATPSDFILAYGDAPTAFFMRRDFLHALCGK